MRATLQSAHSIKNMPEVWRTVQRVFVAKTKWISATYAKSAHDLSTKPANHGHICAANTLANFPTLWSLHGIGTDISESLSLGIPHGKRIGPRNLFANNTKDP